MDTRINSSLQREITPDTRVADIIGYDYPILTVLHHFGIDLGFGEATVRELCAKHGISVRVFIAVSNVYSTPDYLPECDNFEPEDLRTAAEYIHNSHLHYTKEILPHLDSLLKKVLSYYSDIHRKILQRFYDDYRKEVDNHFAYEENMVLPHIKSILSGNAQQGYSMDAFRDNHSDIEEKLNDLKSIIIKYLPSDAPFKDRYELLTEIIRLGTDLTKHSFIENKILIPIASKYEHCGQTD